MKVINVINLKGGVGKTYTSYNIAYELAKRGNKVLVLDNDKQGNISKMCTSYNSDGICAVAKALTGQYNSPVELITHSGYNIDIISSNMSLMAAVWEIATSEGDQISAYKELINANIDNEPLKDRYDYMIIDNPPDIAFNVISALKITDEVIVPVKIDEWALEGLEIISEQVKEAKKINPEIKLLGALVTMYRNDNSNVVGLEWLEKRSNIKVLGKIRYTAKATESTFFNKPAYEYSPLCAAAQDYKRFVNDYLEGAL
jgi:chromosome partitioning protein|nr:MAG TPA: ParA [Bacteriophage sp.]